MNDRSINEQIISQIHQWSLYTRYNKQIKYNPYFNLELIKNLSQPWQIILTINLIEIFNYKLHF